MRYFGVAMSLFFSQSRGDSTMSTYPGQCASYNDCSAAYGSGYDCVAVQSNVAGLEKLTMCIPSGSICSGRLAGTCPTFSSWPGSYRVVQPVCAFTSCTTSTNTSEVSADCYNKTYTVGSTNVIVRGIYKCMDGATYIKSDGGHGTNLTSQQITACGGDSSASTLKLCNQHGTCAPQSDFSDVYACRCNAGYNLTDNCATITSNVCNNLGQCGAMGACVIANGQTSGACTCKSGAGGNQCSKCEQSANTCNGHGTCAANGTCTCSDGYEGSFCDVAPSTGGKRTTTKTGDAVSHVSQALGLLFTLASAILLS